MCDSFQMIKLTYDEDDIESTDIAIKKAGFAIKGILKAIPILGNILGPMIGYFDEKSTFYEIENMKKSFENVYDILHDLEVHNKLIEHYPEQQQREYYFLFKKFMSAVYNQPDEEYIEYLTKYISNCMNKDFSNLTMKISILNKIAKYTHNHIELLYDIYLECKKEGRTRKYVGTLDANIQYCINEMVGDGFIVFAVKNATYQDLSDGSPHEISLAGTKVLEMTGKI